MMYLSIYGQKHGMYLTEIVLFKVTLRIEFMRFCELNCIKYYWDVFRYIMYFEDDFNNEKSVKVKEFLKIV